MESNIASTGFEGMNVDTYFKQHGYSLQYKRKSHNNQLPSSPSAATSQAAAIAPHSPPPTPSFPTETKVRPCRIGLQQPVQQLTADALNDELNSALPGRGT